MRRYSVRASYSNVIVSERRCRSRSIETVREIAGGGDGVIEMVGLVKLGELVELVETGETAEVIKIIKETIEERN